MTYLVILHDAKRVKADTHYPFERAVWTARSNGSFKRELFWSPVSTARLDGSQNFLYTVASRVTAVAEKPRDVYAHASCGLLATKRLHSLGL